MDSLTNFSGPAYQQANSLSTQSNDGGGSPGQQGLPKASGIDHDPSGSAPGPIDISQREVRVPTRKISYLYKLPFAGKSYKVVTEKFTYDDGSPGLRLTRKNNNTRFLECSVPFSNALGVKRNYIEPDFDEEIHKNTLMLIKNYTENEGCLEFLVKNDIVKVVGSVRRPTPSFPMFLVKNDIVKVVGEAKPRYVNFPIVQLIT